MEFSLRIRSSLKSVISYSQSNDRSWEKIGFRLEIFTRTPSRSRQRFKRCDILHRRIALIREASSSTGAVLEAEPPRAVESRTVYMMTKSHVFGNDNSGTDSLRRKRFSSLIAKLSHMKQASTFAINDLTHVGSPTSRRHLSSR